jgi:hypothetical protein
MRPEALALLRRRKERLIGWARHLLLAAFLVLLGSMLLYTREIDSPAMANVLVPHDLLRMRFLSGVTDLGIRRLWGGPATIEGLGVCGDGLLALGLISLVEARLGGRKVSKVGLALVIAALPLFGAVVAAKRDVGGAYFVRPADAATMRHLVELRQPAVLATLNRGGVADLPETGARAVVGVRGGMRPSLADTAAILPVKDQAAGESLRFVRAQEALIAGDRPALHALLARPIHLADPDPDARSDIAQRLVAIEAFAGTPALAARDRGWVEAGASQWRLSLRLSHLLRRLFQLLLAAGLATLVTGLIIRRRLKRIDTHLEIAAAAPLPAGANLHLTTTN